ncbi:MAG: hypothetical protein ACLTYF_27895, partial [Escherichia sp.]
MLIRVDYSGLLDLPIFTRYQYIAIVGEKVSCVFLINHYLSLNKYCINLGLPRSWWEDSERHIQFS